MQQRAESFEETVTQIQTKVNNLGNVNQLFNTEFSPDFSGWTTEYRWKNGLISDDYSFFKKEIWKANSSSIMDYTIGNSAIIISEPLPYNQSSGSVAASAYIGNGYNGSVVNDGVVALRIVFYDANKNYIGKSSGNTVVTSTTMKYVSDYMTPPDGTAYVAINLSYSGTTGLARISQPMLVFNSTSTGSYVPGNYNNNQAVAQVKLTADGLYETVNNPTTGIATRLLTAEGAVTTVQNATKELTYKQTETAGGLTQEISDRKTGDKSVRTDMATLINQQIQSANDGFQSAITQASNAIMASVSGVNLFTFSRFEDSGNNKWPGARQVTGTITKWGYFDSGNNGISVTSTAAWQGFWHSNIPVSPGQVLSASVMINNNGRNDDAGRLDIWFVDKSGNRVSAGGNAGIGSANGWVMAKIENMTVPSGVAYMQVSLLNRIAVGSTHYALPMVNVGTKALPYTPDVAGQTALQLFADSFALSLKDNTGNIISGINGDPSGMTIAAKKLTVSADTTFLGTNWMNGAIIKNASISTAQIADASITSAKIANLDVNKLSGNVTNFIRSYWSNAYGSQVSINANLIKLTAGSGNATVLSDRLQFKNGSSDMSLALLPWTDIHGHLTNAIGSWLLTTGPANSFVSFDSPEGGSFMTFASSQMNYGANENIVRKMLNIFSPVNISNGLYFYGHPGNTPSQISVDDGRRTMNFYTGNKSPSEPDGNYFWFNQNVYSSGVFASTSRLSKKNVKSAYEEDALSEIAKTQLVNFEYKNRIGQNHVSPIIDDVNDEKEYYIPETIVDQNGEYVDMYSMISMAWKAIQQLNEKIGEK